MIRSLFFHKKPEDCTCTTNRRPRHQAAGARQPRPRPDERVDGPVERLLRRVLKFACGESLAAVLSDVSLMRRPVHTYPRTALPQPPLAPSLACSGDLSIYPHRRRPTVHKKDL